MARIRSIHPGLFTDEAFVAVSDAAQILFIGLLTEADDNGLFEWKPITLRLRLRACKDGPVEALLSELEAVNSVRKYELGGRHYGAIRNFRKYQRPKKPNSVHPITDEIRTYVALNGVSSEPEDDDEPPVPQKGELAPQMEDGGGRMKDGKTSSVPSDVSSEPLARSKQADLPAVTSPVFIAIRTNVKSEDFPVTEADIAKYQALYPAVNVEQELRNMAGWSDANEERRKTRRGMRKFINGWLARQQDKGRTNGSGTHAARGNRRPGFGAVLDGLAFDAERHH